VQENHETEHDIIFKLMHAGFIYFYLLLVEKINLETQASRDEIGHVLGNHLKLSANQLG